MPEKLLEISGISYVKSGLLICVEDERGLIYSYDLASKQVISQRRFAGDGDYEDVAIFSDMVFVLKSNGDLYRFSFIDSEIKTDEYDTRLSSENDTEGLCFDPVSNRLLIACKEKKGLKGEKTEGNNIYAFSLSENSLTDEPFMSLSAGTLKAFFEENRSYNYDIDRIVVKPSGIAYNPLDGFYYILASVGKMMVVVNKDGNIMATYSIPEELLIQPEGITFSPQGELWISSEGVNGPGRILHYKPMMP